jgi:hypothetical protein
MISMKLKRIDRQEARLGVKIQLKLMFICNMAELEYEECFVLTLSNELG